MTRTPPGPGPPPRRDSDCRPGASGLAVGFSDRRRLGVGLRRGRGLTRRGLAAGEAERPGRGEARPCRDGRAAGGALGLSFDPGCRRRRRRVQATHWQVNLRNPSRFLWPPRAKSPSSPCFGPRRAGPAPGALDWIICQ